MTGALSDRLGDAIDLLIESGNGSAADDLPRWAAEEGVQLLLDARSRIEALEQALSFYATPENYRPTGWQGDPTPAAIITDAGTKARAAVATDDEPEPHDGF